MWCNFSGGRLGIRHSLLHRLRARVRWGTLHVLADEVAQLRDDSLGIKSLPMSGVTGLGSYTATGVMADEAWRTSPGQPGINSLNLPAYFCF